MLRPEVRRRRIWLHDCSLCRVLYFTFIVGRGNPCAKKAATQTMSGCKKTVFTDRMYVCLRSLSRRHFPTSWPLPLPPGGFLGPIGSILSKCILSTDFVIERFLRKNARSRYAVARAAVWRSPRSFGAFGVLWSPWPLRSAHGSTCKCFGLVFEATWCPDPGTQWLVLWCGGVRGPLEPLESLASAVGSWKNCIFDDLLVLQVLQVLPVLLVLLVRLVLLLES